MRLIKTVFLLIGIVAASGCASSSSLDSRNPFSLKEGKFIKNYKAYTLNFNGISPGVVEQEYKSVVEISVRSHVRSYRFSNYISGRKEPDVVVTLVIAGRTGGLVIYDGSGKILAQYARGKARNDSVFFEVVGEKGTVRIKWFIGHRTIISVFESYNVKNQLGSSETTFYKTELGGR